MLKKLQSERGKSVKSKKKWKIKNYCIEKNCHVASLLLMAFVLCF